MNLRQNSRLLASLLSLFFSAVAVAQTDGHKAKETLDALLKEFPGMFRDALHEYAKVRLQDETLMEPKEEFAAANKITELKLDRASDSSPQASFRLGNPATPKNYWLFTLKLKDETWVFSRAITSQDGIELTLLDNDSGPFLRKALAQLQSKKPQ